MPSRTRVIEFYRRLGFTETEPYPDESPDPMTYMERRLDAADPSYEGSTPSGK